MRLIDAALADSESSGVVVCGSAGVGKTRVARAALDDVASGGWEVRWVVGTSLARALPLGALASWAASTGSDPLELVRGVIEALTSAPAGCAVAVGVDDAHLLDDLSVVVLQHIVQQRAAKLLLTVRNSEPIPTGVQEVWRCGQFHRLDLQPLSRDETVTLLSATLGDSMDPDAAQRLWKLTSGNVLYLRNIVEHEVAAGRLARQHDVWRWSGDPDVPPGLVEMIESRMGALPSVVSDVIDAVAVAEPLELAVLSRVTDRAAVEETETRGLITLEPVADRVQVRVAHPLYGEVRKRRAATTRLRRLRGLIAVELAVADTGDDVSMLVRRAALSLESDLDPDPDLLVSAAKGAVWLADHALAERLTRAAIGAGGGVEAQLVRAHALSWLGRCEDTEEVFAGVDRSELSDTDRAALAVAQATNRLIGLGDPAAAAELIEEAARTTPAQARGCIEAFHVLYWAVLGKPQPAIESAKTVALDQLPDIVGAAPAAGLVLAAGDAGRTSDAVRAAEAATAIVKRSSDSAGMGFAIAHFHVHALVLAGHVLGGWDVAERVREQAGDLWGGARLWSHAVIAEAAIGSGRLQVASSELEQAIEMLAPGGANGTDVQIHILRTMALAIRGLTEDAAAAFAALEACRHGAFRAFDCEVEIARGWVATCRGDISEGIKHVLSAAETAKANGQFAVEVMCLQTAAQFGKGTNATRWRELDGIVEGPRVAVATRFAAALRDRDGAELTAVSEEFERMGDLVAAVDAAAHAAIAYRRRDLKGSALRCSTRAEALAAQCGGAMTPALRQAAERLPLTDREREIAILLGQGLSSRAIAQRLTLSVRTVESHIYRAMAKTGVGDRKELAALLLRRCPP